MKITCQRLSYFLAFIGISILLLSANYLENYVGITPCPLCILQRIVMGILGIIFLFGIVFCFSRWARFSINLLGFLTAVLGIILAGRQVWLQHSPMEASANCDVGLQYMLRVLPLDQVFKKVLVGGTACSQVDWRFLYFSLAEWSLFCFIVIAIFSLVLLIRNFKNPKTHWNRLPLNK